MKIEYLDNVNSKSKYDELKETDFSCDESSLSTDYMKIRDEIIKDFSTCENSCKNIKSYQFDYKFALKLYNIFNSKNWFNSSIAANFEFWQYLSLIVIPDLIFKRHGNQEEYYWSKNVRIYPSTLYWYVKMSYNQNIQYTEQMLASDIFSTDTILNLVERSGKYGIDLNVTRTIMKKYYESRREYYSVLKDMNTFRKIMLLNTAKDAVFLPELYEGGTDGYVDMLFNIVLGGTTNEL